MNDLPIRLNIQAMADNDPLIGYFTQLEAWLNFQGMSANWYSDELAIIEHEFKLVSLFEFEHFKQSHSVQNKDNKSNQVSDNQWVSLNLNLKGAKQDKLLFQSIYQINNQQVELIIAFTPAIKTVCQNQTFSKNVFNKALFELAKRTRDVSYQ